MKPWEETWSAVPVLTMREPRWGIAVAEEKVVLAFLAETYAIQSAVKEAAEKMPARAKLAAQAPEMARLLLKIEWDDRYQDEVCCPVCFSSPPNAARGGHDADCKLDMVLRAAGVRT